MSGEILSNRLAGHFCRVTFDDLNADHVARMKGFFLDWLGSAYAGKDLPLATGGRTLRPSKVEMVDLRIYQAAIDLLGNIDPKTPYLAKFNLPFCVATALRYGHVQSNDFTSVRLEDKDLKELMKKIKVGGDPDLTGAYPCKWPACVTIILKDGRRLKGTNEYPKGDPENPLSERELIAKFKGLTSGALSARQAEWIWSFWATSLNSSNDRVRDILKFDPP